MELYKSYLIWIQRELYTLIMIAVIPGLTQTNQGKDVPIDSQQYTLLSSRVLNNNWFLVIDRKANEIM